MHLETKTTSRYKLPPPPPNISPQQGCQYWTVLNIALSLIFFTWKHIPLPVFSPGFFLVWSPRSPSAEKKGPCKNITGTKLLEIHHGCRKKIYVKYMVFLPWNSSLVFICCTLSSSLPSPPEISSSYILSSSLGTLGLGWKKPSNFHSTIVYELFLCQKKSHGSNNLNIPTWSKMVEDVFTIWYKWCSGMYVKATKFKTLNLLISCFLFIQASRMLEC